MSAPTIKLPPAMEVRVLLEDLLGRDVDVRAGNAWRPALTDHASAAEFVDDQLRLRVVTVLDLPLAVGLGAAVGLVPPTAVQEMLLTKSASDMVRENLYEVLNVLSSIFNKRGAAHLRIHRLHSPGILMPPDVAETACRLVGRLDLVVTVKGYGTGRLALVHCG